MLQSQNLEGKDDPFTKGCRPSVGGLTDPDERNKINFILSEEYQDFKEFLSDELGVDEFNELYEKFLNKD